MAPKLLALAAVLYAGAWVASWLHLARTRLGTLPWGSRLLGVGVLVHGAGVLVRMVEQGVPPATSGLEGLALLSLFVAVTFFTFSKRYPVEAVGAFASPLVCLTLTASLIFGPENADTPEALKTGYFVVHIALAFLGNAFLALAAAAAGAYILQDRALRLKKFTSGGIKLPNITVIDHLVYRCVTLGFLFMSLGIVSGIVYSKHAWHAYWSWDPRQTWSLATWLAYAALMHARITTGWHGRRWAWLTMGAFVLVISASVVLDVFKLGRHSGAYDARPTAVGEP